MSSIFCYVFSFLVGEVCPGASLVQLITILSYPHPYFFSIIVLSQKIHPCFL